MKSYGIELNSLQLLSIVKRLYILQILEMKSYGIELNSLHNENVNIRSINQMFFVHYIRSNFKTSNTIVFDSN